MTTPLCLRQRSFLARRSSCLPEGFQVVFEHSHYNVFEFEVLARCTPIRLPIHAKRGAVAA